MAGSSSSTGTHTHHTHAHSCRGLPVSYCLLLAVSGPLLFFFSCSSSSLHCPNFPPLLLRCARRGGRGGTEAGNTPGRRWWLVLASRTRTRPGSPAVNTDNTRTRVQIHPYPLFITLCNVDMSRVDMGRVDISGCTAADLGRAGVAVCGVPLSALLRCQVADIASIAIWPGSRGWCWYLRPPSQSVATSPISRIYVAGLLVSSRAGNEPPQSFLHREKAPTRAFAC